MSDWRIRGARSEDLAALADLFDDYLDEHQPWDPQFAATRNTAFDGATYLAAALACDTQRILVAERGRRLFGFVRVSIAAPELAPAPRLRRAAGRPWGLRGAIRATLRSLLRLVERWPGPGQPTRLQASGVISDLYVARASRRLGAGADLVAGALAWMERRRVHVVSLQVLEDNSGGRRFWAAVGFSPYRRTLILDRRHP